MLFSINNPFYQYVDEDNETISVDVQLEFIEAMRFIKENNTFLIVGEKSIEGSSYQFIEDLPLLRSQITTDDGNFETKGRSEQVVYESVVVENKSESVKSEENKMSDEGKGNAEKEVEKNINFSEFEDLGGFEEKEEKNEGFFNIEEEQKTEIKDRIVEKNDISSEVFELVEDNKPLELQKPEESKSTPFFALEPGEIIESQTFKNIEIIKEPINPFDFSEIRSLIKSELRSSIIDMSILHYETCNNCRITPIRGILYKCPKCYHYYLCSDCEDSIIHSHSLLKLKKPQPHDPTKEVMERIHKKLKFNDKDKIMNALHKFNNDYDKTVNFLLNE
ncbi:hypothetical protein SteCoe_12831 [Stentor coeruleus]|uniref:ZZ-type domain-containing protein n=1 Tax=Stentor coeruleus TaxID=5963 RepID=A0A1R2C9W9_9CILI|nr:hypothetical protein SteCoe_12831 [Stentor coeruleus]